jgi:glycerol-3-phosphate cytidylyltransferase
MTTIITYGTFDLFHYGHLRLLERLSRLGDRLVVGVSTDDFNAVKGKRSVIPYEQRAAIVLGCRYVYRVIPEQHWDQKRNDIVDERADIFAMGDDWAGKFDHLGDICRVLYLPRTQDISSTAIRARARDLKVTLEAPVVGPASLVEA